MPPLIRWPILGLFLFTVGFWTLGGSGTQAQDNPARPGGFTPSEAVDRMTMPEGFHAEIVASEPMIRQPVAACYDERGRLWVIEYLQYPNPEGLKPVTVDQYLRTEYDRVPEPPPAGPKGVDRVKVLEDTDGDGRMDKETIFIEGLNLASAIAVGHGGVFIGQTPYLLFYPDRNRDDRPDSDPEVLLKGFGMQDAPCGGQFHDVGTRRLALRSAGVDRDRQYPGDRVPAGHLAVSPPDQGVRTVRRGRRQYLGTRFRPRGERLR